MIFLLSGLSYFDWAIDSSHYLLGFGVLDELGRLNTFVDIPYGIVHRYGFPSAKLLLVEILFPEVLKEFSK